MIAFPNAKINLGLNVVSRRADGYHNLETVFCPVRLADALEVIESSSFSFQITGIDIDGDPEKNLVVRAYRLLQNDFDLPPVEIHLHKLIPTGAGLGGGSSDAAFMLKMLNSLFNLQLTVTQLERYAARLGADCPFFIGNQPAFATGIGDQLQPFPLDLSKYLLLIVKPAFSVSTAQAYRDVVPRIPAESLVALLKLPPQNWKESVFNDFEPSVFAQFPEIGQIKATLYRHGAVYASMSGSGSAVFGLFPHSPTDLTNDLPSGCSVYR